MVSEVGIAAGVRRIEAVTGQAAYQSFVLDAQMLQAVAGHLKVPKAELSEAVNTLQAKLKASEKSLQSLKARAATGVLDELMASAVEVLGVRLLTAEVTGISDLRDFMDKAKHKLTSGIIVFGQQRGEKVQLVAGVTSDLTAQYHAGNIVREVAAVCGGKGGGKPDMAMAGGSEPEKLQEALALVPTLLQPEP